MNPSRGGESLQGDWAKWVRMDLQSSLRCKHPPKDMHVLLLLVLESDRARFSSPARMCLSCNDSTDVAMVTPLKNWGPFPLSRQPQSGRFSNYDVSFNKTASAYSTVLDKSRPVFKGDREIKTDKERSTVAWYLGICIDPEQWPTSKLADLITFVKARAGHYGPSCQNNPLK